MQIGFLELLVVVAFFASIFALFSLGTDQKTVWATKPLEFEKPRVPTVYLEGKGAPIRIPIKWIHEERYRDGQELFSENYRSGWERCRREFFENGSWRYPARYPIQQDFDLSQSWEVQHCWQARLQGWLRCAEQINLLLQTQWSEQELRRAIGYSAYWHTIPAATIACVSLWAVWFFRKGKLIFKMRRRYLKD